MRILITGKNGFIGKALLEYFISKNHDVIAIGREDVDLTDKKKVDACFSSSPSFPAFDAVFHCAIRGSRRTNPMTAADFHENLLAFENLKSNITKYTSFVVFGSGAEFDKSRNIDCLDTYNLGRSIPTDYYGLSKYIITQRMINTTSCHDPTNCFVLRLFGCFGPTESDERFIKSAIRCLKNGETFILDQDKYMDYFYIKDVINICESILISGCNYRTNFTHSVNLCYDEHLKLSQILEIIDPNLKFEIKKPGLGLSYTGRCDLHQGDLIGLRNGIEEMKKSLL